MVMSNGKLFWFSLVLCSSSQCTMKLIKQCIKGLVKYMESSNIHGFKYIVEKNQHWSERLFWVIFCVLSWYACLVTAQSIYRMYVDKPIAIAVDTINLDWRTPFPTVAVCNSFNQAAKEHAAAIITKYSNGTLNGRGMAEQLFLPFNLGYLKKLESLNISVEDYVSIYKRVKTNCNDTFVDCKWNERPFNCCNEFVSIYTSIGYCQMLNSKHARPRRPSVDFSVNRTHTSAFLSFDFKEKYKQTNGDIQLFILNNVEIPTIFTSSKKILKNLENITDIEFNIVDIINEINVKSVSPDKRECRFLEENKGMRVYNLYSFDGCITEGDIKQMLQMCGCIGQSYPHQPGMSICNMTEMKCISQYRSQKSSSLDFDCLPNCEGSTINWYSFNKESESFSNVRSGIRMKMLSKPRVRYQRYVVRSLLDVFVAIGNAVGLFTGASILTILELIYWLLCESYKPT